MKFSILALLGVTAVSTTTIKIDDGTLQKIAGIWQTNERQLEQTLQGLFDQEMKELDPYFQKVMGNAQKVQQIGDQYNQKVFGEVMNAGQETWATTYKQLGCDPAHLKSTDVAYHSCVDPEHFVEHLPRSFGQCGCKNPPVTIANQVTCFTDNNGKVACGEF